MDLSGKLQLKPGQQLEGVLVPAAIASALPALNKGDTGDALAGLLVFVLNRSALEAHRPTIAAAVAAGRLTWVGYPKAGQLGTDLNRDSLASLLAESEVQPVRQVSIDDVWSALRFRPA